MASTALALALLLAGLWLTAVYPALAQDGRCPDGWTFSDITSDSCYRYFGPEASDNLGLPTQTSWNTAHSSCQSLGSGSNLVSIHSLQENDLVYGLCTRRRCHIGYNDIGELEGGVSHHA